MKKSTTHLIVIAMSAVFALSACERRQRPPKPKTEQKEKGNNTDGGSLTDGKTNTTQGDEKKTPEQAAADQLQKTIDDLNSRLKAIGEQEQALIALNLGVKVAKNAETGAEELSMDRDAVLNAIRDAGEKSTASGEDGAPNAENFADKLHTELTKLHALVTDYLKTYSDEKGGPVQIEGFTEAQSAKLASELKAFEAKHKKIDDLDNDLHSVYKDSFEKSPAGHLDPK